MRQAAFLDRDGVLNRAIERNGRSYSPHRLEDFHILPEAPEAVDRLHRAGFLTIVVTNQPDVGNGKLDRDVLDAMHHELRAAMPLDDIRVCTCADTCPRHKPNPGMLLEHVAGWDVDLSRSFMIGDRWRDIGAGRSAGCTTVFIDRHYDEVIPDPPDLVVSNVAEAVDRILTFPLDGEEVS